MYTESVLTSDLTVKNGSRNPPGPNVRSPFCWKPALEAEEHLKAATQKPKCGSSSLPAEPSAAEALRSCCVINDRDVRADYSLRLGLQCKCPVRLKITMKPFPTYSSPAFCVQPVRSSSFAVKVGFWSCKSFEFMPAEWLAVALGVGWRGWGWVVITDYCAGGEQGRLRELQYGGWKDATSLWDVRDNKRRVGSSNHRHNTNTQRPPTPHMKWKACLEAEATTKNKAGSDTYLGDVRHVRAGAPGNLSPPAECCRQNRPSPFPHNKLFLLLFLLLLFLLLLFSSKSPGLSSLRCLGELFSLRFQSCYKIKEELRVVQHPGGYTANESEF